MMAHFAEISEQNIVLRVLVVDNSQEHRGQDFLANDLGLGGKWIQTSYNSNFRNKFAAIGDTYDEIKDVFIEPKPFESWILDDNLIWIPPIPKPEGINSIWDETKKEWVEIEINPEAV